MIVIPFKLCFCALENFEIKLLLNVKLGKFAHFHLYELCLFVYLFVCVYGILPFIGYLRPNPFLYK